MIKIGEIPRRWETVKLGDGGACQIIMGQSPPSSTYNKLREGLPFLQGNMEFGEIYPSPSIYCSEPAKIAEQNDVLISVRAPVGDVNISSSRVCIGRGLAAIRCKPNNTNYLFLFYYLKYIGKTFESISAGSTFKAIKKNDLGQLEILLPPFPEQKKIAEILTTVDHGIEKVDEAIIKTQRLKKGLMQELLTIGIGHKEFKDTEVGRVPKEWEIWELRELIDIKSGLYFKFSEFTNSGIRCLKIDNVGFGEVTWKTITFLPENYLEEYSDLLLKEGDVVIALNRPIIDGKFKIGILKEDAPSILYQRVGKIFIKDKKVNSRFLFYLFCGDHFKSILLKSLVGTDQPYIRTPILLKLKLSFPPLPEQQKIAEMLGTVDKRLESLRNRKEKLERVKKGLMDDLLTGRTRVQLD